MGTTYNYHPELKTPESMGSANFSNPLVKKLMGVMAKGETKKVLEWTAPEGICVRSLQLTMSDGEQIAATLIEPSGEEQPLPLLLSCHGGGFMMPLQVPMLELSAQYAHMVPCRVLLPDYRTALKNPFPIPLQDCYDSLCAAVKRSDELRIDIERVLVYGDSAGGCLAAGTAQMARDHQGPTLRGQLLIYPVTDDSSDYSSMDEYAHAVWTKKANSSMWKAYLARNAARGTDDEKRCFDMAAYARPLRNPNLSNLPPAYVEPAECDILRDEGIAYADALKAAAVETELNVIDGAFHTFDEQHESPLVQRVIQHRVEVMRKLLGD